MWRLPSAPGQWHGRHAPRSARPRSRASCGAHPAGRSGWRHRGGRPARCPAPPCARHWTAALRSRCGAARRTARWPAAGPVRRALRAAAPAVPVRHCPDPLRRAGWHRVRATVHPEEWSTTPPR
ncbi:hypothetical protein G6F24_017969 [Rhizopus arrhizus]|nr:hypothetical protein G6F24_017969 [Rhizopus arrhizus]